MDKKQITPYILSSISFILLIAGYVTSWSNSKYTISEIFLYTELAFFWVVPLFFVTLLFAMRGNLKARLIWLGLLSLPFFKVNEKATYLVGLNYFFFLTSFSFALFAIILGIYNLDIKKVKLSLPTRASCIRIAILLIFGFAIIACTYFSTKSIRQNYGIMKSLNPDIVRDFSTVYANTFLRILISGYRIILGVLLPLFLLNIITIIRRKTEGIILTPVVLTYGMVCLTFVMTLNSIISYCGNFKGVVVFAVDYYNYTTYFLNITIPVFVLLYLLFSSLFLVYYMIRIKEINR